MAGKLGIHISQLIFDHDCVIVPSLGGFLASNQPARILRPNEVIYPPYRRIAFNVYLRQNDGLLANHLAKTENITYSEAMRIVDEFAAECFDFLEGGRKVTIEEVGTLFFDKEKNIQFEAFRNFNHLKDSFGMEGIPILPLQVAEKPERKKIAIDVLRPSISADRPKSFLARNRKYIGFAAILGVLGWFSVNLYLIAPQHYESSSLNPFDSQNIVLSSADSIRNVPESVEAKVIVPGETVATVETASDTLAMNEPVTNETPEEIIVPEKKIIPEPETLTEKKAEANINSDRRHYLIAGVFKVRENALGMLVKLQEQGFSNAQIIDANNCSYVAYDSYEYADQAYSKADSLRSKQLDGWVWKH